MKKILNLLAIFFICYFFIISLKTFFGVFVFREKIIYSFPSISYIVLNRLRVTGASTLWISTNVTKDADSDCSATIAGTLLLFTFTKKASTDVNFDVDNYCIFSLAWQLSF